MASAFTSQTGDIYNNIYEASVVRHEALLMREVLDYEARLADAGRLTPTFHTCYASELSMYNSLPLLPNRYVKTSIVDRTQPTISFLSRRGLGDGLRCKLFHYENVHRFFEFDYCGQATYGRKEDDRSVNPPLRLNPTVSMPLP